MRVRSFTLAAAAALTLAGAAAAADDDTAIRERLAEKFPEVTADDLSPAPVPGLYQIRIGAQVAYVSADGRYLFQGDIFDVETERNLTESARTEARLAAVNAVGEKSMLVFGPASAKHTVTVFTDIDCGYCRKLHREIEQYNERGIRVRYMFFPRSGPNTDSWFKADQVWCAEDRNGALTRAKSGEVLSSRDCGATPVAQHYRLGESFGIRGTPAIITDSGDMIGGYLPPADLAEYLEQ